MEGTNKNKINRDKNVNTQTYTPLSICATSQVENQTCFMMFHRCPPTTQFSCLQCILRSKSKTKKKKSSSRKPKALAILKQTMRIMRMFLVGTREFFKDFRGVLWACWKRCWAAWEGLVWGPPPPLQPEMGGEVDPPTNRATPAQEKFLRRRREIFAKKSTHREVWDSWWGGWTPQLPNGGGWGVVDPPQPTHHP